MQLSPAVYLDRYEHEILSRLRSIWIDPSLGFRAKRPKREAIEGILKDAKVAVLTRLLHESMEKSA